MPKMSSKGATFHAAQDLIYALQNPAPAILIVKLRNGYKEELRTQVEKFSKASPPTIPLRVPVKEIVQEIPQR